jgi:hypothetical protein
VSWLSRKSALKITPVPLKHEPELVVPVIVIFFSAGRVQNASAYLHRIAGMSFDTDVARARDTRTLKQDTARRALDDHVADVIPGVCRGIDLNGSRVRAIEPQLGLGPAADRDAAPARGNVRAILNRDVTEPLVAARFELYRKRPAIRGDLYARADR